MESTEAKDSVPTAKQTLETSEGSIAVESSGSNLEALKEVENNETPVSPPEPIIEGAKGELILEVAKEEEITEAKIPVSPPGPIVNTAKEIESIKAKDSVPTTEQTLESSEEIKLKEGSIAVKSSGSNLEASIEVKNDGISVSPPEPIIGGAKTELILEAAKEEEMTESSISVTPPEIIVNTATEIESTGADDLVPTTEETFDKSEEVKLKEGSIAVKSSASNLGASKEVENNGTPVSPPEPIVEGAKGELISEAAKEEEITEAKIPATPSEAIVNTAKEIESKKAKDSVPTTEQTLESSEE